uniref:Putative secreted protein n=1 Tax=Ixodes ricinus TaxID=34613 RepID=A0A6B0U8D3_IXORI
MSVMLGALKLEGQKLHTLVFCIISSVLCFWINPKNSEKRLPVTFASILIYPNNYSAAPTNYPHHDTDSIGRCDTFFTDEG